MYVPMSWLKEYVDLDCSIEDFSDAMTMSGSKVEVIKHIGQDISKVVVGKIISIDKHPDADKLVITKIDIGETNHLQIVTGATNISVGSLVPVALEGATLAEGIKIKKGKLRGVVSEGMLCSIEELGYTKHDYPEAPEDGIYIFTTEEELGLDVKPILQIEEDVVEFEITSNRADCFSIIGIAREAAATFDKTLKHKEINLKETLKDDINKLIEVKIEDSKYTNRYIARVVKNIKIMPSPLWLRHRLTTSNIKPINNIVDITNYVMLEMGQPLHAFDMSNICDKKIIVRNANDDEVITTLDGIERKLDSTMTVVADAKKPIAIAGIMGGENTKISDNCTEVLFECANFNGPSIRSTSKKLNLRTDSSTKFEKNIDPNLCIQAINRAMELVEMLECGDVVEGCIDAYINKKEETTIEFSPSKINTLLGTNISDIDMQKYLNKLEIKTIGNKAIIPTFRGDLLIQEDIAEEIARMFGYDKIEVNFTATVPTAGKKSDEQIAFDNIKNIMVSMGMYECLTYSFESPKVFDKLLLNKNNELRNAIKITNPLGEDFSIMRTSTINGILKSLSINYNRRNAAASLFELSKIYISKNTNELPEEPTILTMGMYGDKDFFYIKGMIEKLLEILNISDISFNPKKNLEFMHEGRTASIVVLENEVGYLGEIHPSVAKNYEIGTKIYVAVLNVTEIFKNLNTTKVFKEIAKYPCITRDLSIIIKDEIYSKEIEEVINNYGGKLLESIKIFDVYKGTQIDKGYKSMAYTLSFRADDRTLTDEEIKPYIEKIIKKLEEAFDATIRE
jgi:phenylalanyl-tRNA synthetase beta chain